MIDLETPISNGRGLYCIHFVNWVRPYPTLPQTYSPSFNWSVTRTPSKVKGRIWTMYGQSLRLKEKPYLWSYSWNKGVSSKWVWKELLRYWKKLETLQSSPRPSPQSPRTGGTLTPGVGGWTFYPGKVVFILTLTGYDAHLPTGQGPRRWRTLPIKEGEESDSTPGTSDVLGQIFVEDG